MTNKRIGEVLKKYRLDFEMTQGEMARELNKSVAFWSAIESNKKPCPVELADAFSDRYNLPKAKRIELHHLADASKKEYKINVVNVRGDAQSLAATFARKFTELNEDEVRNIQRILDNIE